jgi:tRNA(Arg) A34 adenosine deaminase TadA
MEIALEEARAAAERGEVPVGAVVTDKAGQVLAEMEDIMYLLTEQHITLEIGLLMVVIILEFKMVHQVIIILVAGVVVIMDRLNQVV